MKLKFLDRTQGALIAFGFILILAATGQAIFSNSADLPWFQLLGLLFFLAAAWLLTRSNHLQPAGSSKKGIGILAEGLLLGAILLLAFFLRTYNLDQQPFGCFRDEAQGCLTANDILNGRDVYDTGTSTPIFLLMVPSGYFYPVAVFLKLFGLSVHSMRLVSVFFGLATVAAFYFLARYFMGKGWALLLAFCLACLRWHINFSRIGFLGIMTLFAEIPFAYYLLKALHAPDQLGKQKFTKTWPLLLAWLACLLRVFLGILLPESLQDNEFYIGLPLGLPILYFFYQAWPQARQRLLILAGLILGLSFYTYMAADLLLLLALAYLGYFMLREAPYKPAAQKRAWGLAALLLFACVLTVEGSALAWPWLKVLGQILVGIAVLGLCFFLLPSLPFKAWLRPLALGSAAFLLASGPMLSYRISHWGRATARADRISIFQTKVENRDQRWGRVLKSNLLKTLGMVNVRGDGNPRHNYPNMPMLNQLWAAAFALGLAYCLLNWRQPHCFFLLLWWQAILLAGYFSIDAPQAYRTMAAIPAVLLMAGLALQQVSRLFTRALPDFNGKASLALMGLVFFGFGAYQEYHNYFELQANDPGCYAAFSADEYLMGKDLKAVSPGTHALVRADWDNYTLKFADYPEDDYEIFRISEHLPFRHPEKIQGKNLMYILDDASQPLLPVLRQLYPHGVYNEVRHAINNVLFYWTYLVPAKDLQQPIQLASGLTGHFYADQITNPLGTDLSLHWRPENLKKTRLDSFLLFHWAQYPLSVRYFSAEWTGSLMISKAGGYGFWTFSDSYTSLDIDGKNVLQSKLPPEMNAWNQGQAYLSPGRHRIRLRYYLCYKDSQLQVWWQAPGDKNKSLIPTDVLRPN